MMKLTKMLALILIGSLTIGALGCSTTITSADSMTSSETIHLLNSGHESRRNSKDQIIPVKSTPSGATVLIDGEEQGTTPITLKRTRGEHEYTIEIVKEGYQKETVILKGKLFKIKPPLFSQESFGEAWYYEYAPESINVTLKKR